MVTTTATTHQLPEAGFLRIWQIIGNPKAKPPIPAIIPVSRSTFLAWVKSGKAPAPCKLSERTTAWKVSDIYDFVEKLNTTQYTATKNIDKKVAR
jgi:prophage regulatory protein